MHEKQRKVIQDLYSKTKNWKIRTFIYYVRGLCSQSRKDII